MDPNEIKAMIEAGIANCQAEVSGDGSHFDAIVVSPEFEGKNMMQEHRMVYATLGDSITSGRLHALSIKAYTPDEFAAQKG
ncbi:MAG: BolA family transcriptional regulator [Gammaproteobacteria bacterium]|nr:BolA family transcriptional regulator [Gammaproteobacteria bacterium]